MKVIITVPCLSLPGGVANYYSVLRKHLDDNKIYFEVGSRGAEVSSLQSVKHLIDDWLRFRKELDTRTVDLVHINPSLGIKSIIRDGVLLLLAKHKQKKVVVFFRGWDLECESLIRRRFSILFRHVFGRADAFIVLGKIFKQKINEFGISKPFFLETTLVDDEIESLQTRQVPTSESNNNRILFLSRLDSGKGLLESLRAFKQLQKIRPSVCITIAGDGPMKAEAERYVKTEKLKNVEFPGHISGKDKGSEYKRADIFLFPTYYGEGMPNSVLEAMAYGIPVVTSTAGGLKDFFEHERMGRIVNPHNITEICIALDSLLENPVAREEIGQYNRKYALKNFAASSVAKRIVKIYEQVINQPI